MNGCVITILTLINCNYYDHRTSSATLSFRMHLLSDEEPFLVDIIIIIIVVVVVVVLVVVDVEINSRRSQ